MEFFSLTINGKVKKVTRGGRTFYVANATLIIPGVLNGSQGPLYYPTEEIQKNVSNWNGIPLVIYHPVRNGQPISGRDPEVIPVGNLYKVVFNTSLQGEAWFDVEMVKSVDKRVLDFLESGKDIELSTGLFTTNEPSNGEFNGKNYTHIARNYIPDHLAILPDQVGACSIKDGCGILLNSEKQPFFLDLGISNIPQIDHRTEEEKMNRDELIKWLTTNCNCYPKDDLEKMSDKTLTSLKSREEQSTKDKVIVNSATKGFEGEGVTGKWCSTEGKFVVNKVTETPKKVEEPITKPKTAKEWLNEAPEEIKIAVNHSTKIVQREKKTLIDRLVANQKSKGKTDEELQAYGQKMMTKDLEELQERVDDLPPVSNTDNSDETYQLPQTFAGVGPVGNRGVKLDDNDLLLPVTSNSYRDNGKKE